MIELPDIDLFPVDEVVAGLARGSQTAFVEILMAGQAARREAKVRTIEVLDLDGRAFLL